MSSAAGRAGDADDVFGAAVRSMEAGVAQQRSRPELSFGSQPPPRKLAPYAAAVGATVHGPAPRRTAGGPGEPGPDIAWGTFVLLCDPAGQPGWAGPLRVVVYVRAELDPEIAADPLAGQVGWTWLSEALDRRAPEYQQASGTVTRVVTESFGTKSGEQDATTFELRASWSPAGSSDLAGHVAAWCQTLCTASGLPPLPDGVRSLRPAQLRHQRR